MSQLTRSRPTGPRSGGVLVLALVAVSAVAVMAMCLLQVSTSSMRRQRSGVATKQAFYLAEAGLAEAYAGLAIGRTGNVGSANLPAAYGDGLLWVEAEDLPPDRVRLTSTGMVAGGRAVLALVVERGETSVASLGLFSANSILVPGGSVLDAYDSSLGYTPPAPDVPIAHVGRVGSNQAVQALDDPILPTLVYADLEAGPGLSPSLAARVQHVGTLGARAEALPLPHVTLPSEPVGPALLESDGVPRVLPPGTLVTQRLEVAKGAEVVVKGPCSLVAGEVVVASGGTLTFDSSAGQVSVHVAGRFSLAEGSWIGTTAGDPSRLVVQVRDGLEEVALSATGAFHGVLYAPQARMRLGSSFEVFGAAVADELILGPGAKVHFDVHLDEVALDATLPRLLSWSIVDLAPVAGLAGLMGPQVALGLEGQDLPSPADAHQDQMLHLVYLDAAGVQRTYDGWESAFDWTLPSQVLRLTRDGNEVNTLTGAEPSEPPPSEPSEASPSVLGILADEVALGPGGMTDALLALPELTQADLATVIAHYDLFISKELGRLLSNAPKITGPLLHAVLDTGMLVSGDLSNVMVHNSPLPDDVLARVLLLDNLQLKNPHRSAILAVN